MLSSSYFFVFQVVEETAQNCRSRALLLLKRIDVTVNSFLWSQRLKPREAQIRELFTKRRAGISIVNPPDVACLLAASQDLLRIEQASNEKVRKNTHSMMSPLALAPRPADRGGRTNEMIGDIAREQASAQRGRGRGGGGGGGGGFRGQHAPQQPRQQYDQSRGGGYRDQQYMQPRDQQYGGYGGYGDQQYGGQQQYGMSREQMEESLPMTVEQTRALFLVNSLPFIGFGFLDNVIMILAGEYIDQQLGTLLCLSTMAAAAFGNLISDVAGVGLAHYVEGIVNKCGIKHPVLTSEQLESSRARWTTHSGRAIGLSIGCIIGMFPLLFFNSEEDEKAEKKSSK
ncbi:hypothetical protein OESDEN_08802 [Oesophagostomum dentatum]|uniref:Transmembrane protein 65 n=1 Tax=Oesophagostomum dentatum TaxID=61180 RepID=A0A0B1T6A5_OESDE|nr:hypothetical protein OESDEN_08802 [Oesophagostomum dentatum]